MNQLPLVDSSACCDIANALVAGKLNPQQALARTSIWSALSRFASRDMSETYPGLLADRKQNKFACPSKCGAMRRRAGVAPRKNSTSFSRCNGDRVRMRQFLSERNLASTISKNQSCRVDSLSWRCRFWQYPRRSNRPACKGLRKLLDRSKRKLSQSLARGPETEKASGSIETENESPVKARNQTRFVVGRGPHAGDRHQRRADPGGSRGHLRHRPAHLQMGRLGDP